MTIWTIGHSTRSAEEFTAILKAHRIERVVDIRTVPRSRHNPQFNSADLRATLAAAGIEYAHLPGLGGLRHPRKDSTNTAWKNDSFRGYADYMLTSEFASNLTDLMESAREKRVAMMCAEAVPWRCHRSLVADALAVRGIDVRHLLAQASEKPHTITSFAHAEGGRVSYPGLPVPTLR